MPVNEMAERLNTSVTNIKRAFRGKRLWFHNGKYKNRPELVESVLAYYAKHGKNETIKRFPDVKVKCIVDRPEYYGHSKPKRQIRWTDKQILEAARMAGLVSLKGQARYFNRPNADVGSIQSLWTKRFQMGSSNVNGMVHWYAKELVNHRARYIQPLGLSRADKLVKFRRVILWVDMEKCLKANVPSFIREAVKTMADFQRWLHGSDNPRAKILRMIETRELPA
jgi:AcrR family transcriptional regulator